MGTNVLGSPVAPPSKAVPPVAAAEVSTATSASDAPARHARLRALHELSNAALIDLIRDEKRRLGRALLILGHHYQRHGIIEVADIRGDSFGLAEAARDAESVRDIVFCGVRFMVESAATLVRADQRVFHPCAEAGCPMADMADLPLVERALDELGEVLDSERLVPITYMNSDVALKALCGRNGGTICTSSNAVEAFRWALARGERIFFLPDEFLGRNTAARMGMPASAVKTYDPQRHRGGLTPDELIEARVLVYKGYCHVHTWFQPEFIAEFRGKFPAGQVIVHPECVPALVAKADLVGSTGFIKRTVEAAPAGSAFAIGTESNMVLRLQYEHPDKTILELSRSICPNMYKINLPNLYDLLSRLGTDDEPEPVRVAPELARDARLALKRMLAIN